MSPRRTFARPSTRIIVFIAAVVVGTALVIVLVQWATNSWAVGAIAGVIAAVLSTVIYPIVFRKS